MLIQELRKRKGRALHFTLFDPDRQRPEEAGRFAAACRDSGTDAIMVGGSGRFRAARLERTVAAVKSGAGLPTILFPGSALDVTPAADYIFFMSLLNADHPRFLIREQAKAAPGIARSGPRAISMGYIVVSTSRRKTSVEKRAARDRIGKNDVEKAVSYALAGRFLGMSCLYLEAGSGADAPVSARMAFEVKTRTGLPLLVGGGIRTPSGAGRLVAAGADVIVTGTIVERDLSRLRDIISAVQNRSR